MTINVQAIGTIGSEIDIRYFESGTHLTKFGVYSSNGKKNNSEEWNPSTWLNCEAWGDIGEHIGTTFKKGDRVAVTGTLHTSEWKKDDGEVIKRDYLRVQSIGKMPEKKDESESPRQSKKSSRSAPAQSSQRKWDPNEEPNLDNVPF